MMKAIAEPLLELETHPDMAPTRVMIRGGRSLVRKLVLVGRLGAALLMLVAFGVLAPLNDLSFARMHQRTSDLETAALDSRPRGKLGQALKGGHELGSAIGVTAVVN